MSRWWSRAPRFRTARLKRGSVVLAAALALTGLAATAASATPPDAELITVTDDGFVATWTTSEASDTTVCFGRAQGSLDCQAQEPDTRFHRAEVDGLESGQRYFYSLRSDNVPQAPSSTNPGSFTTLQEPPGEHLFDFAVVSDTHIGEQCSGTAVTFRPPAGSVPPCFSSDQPYAATMTRAAVDELNDRGLGLAILNADNTSHGEYDQAAELKDIFEGFNGERHLARGPHDRAEQNDADPRCGDDNDCFRAVFFPDRPEGRIYYSFDYRRHHFVALDSANPGDGVGDLSDPDQLAFLERDLEQARQAGQKTFIFFHHPVSEYANTTAFPPLVFGVRPDRGGTEFLELVSRFPNVVGVLNAHTHRNYVSYSPETGARLPFIENGPTKEYPGGYSVFSVYSGGYMRNFQRLECSFCREWTSTTRDEYLGLYPLYTLGTLSARNFTHVYDCDVPTPPPSPPTGNESAIGGDTSAACPSGDEGEPPPGPGQRPSCNGERTTITGTSGDDTIRGTAGVDVIRARPGEDVVRARGGNDVICANEDEDAVRAGGGDDYVSGGRGDDDDRLRGGAGDDEIRAQRGEDVLGGGGGSDFLLGNRQDDLLLGGKGPDRLLGNKGDDELRGGRGRDTVRGGAGRDARRQ